MLCYYHYNITKKDRTSHLPSRVLLHWAKLIKYMLKLFTKQETYSYNPSENTMRHFYLLAFFPFNTSETELPYCHHKVRVRVAEQDAERLKGSLEIRKVKKSFGSSSRKLNKMSYQNFYESPTLLDFIN